MNIAELAGKSVIIIGFGLEGQSTYAFLRTRCPDQEIAIADRKPLSSFELSPDMTAMIALDPHLKQFTGPDYLDRVLQYDIAVKSPGIPFNHSGVRKFADAGGIVTSNLALFFGAVSRNRIIGITGTKGKSTTASLLFHLTELAGFDARLGGNIGPPFGLPFLSLLDNAKDDTLFILELSSYQLDRLTYSPHVAVLLNINPEHIGRHEPSSEEIHHRDFEEYVSAKENITHFQDSDDYLVVNLANNVPWQIALRSRAQIIQFSTHSELNAGCYFDRTDLIYSNGRNRHRIATIADIPLVGKYNRENVLAAVAAAIILGVPPNSIASSLRSFKPLPHRIEFVGEHQGIRFYDDSIASAPEAPLNALDALRGDVQTLIVGGHERGLDYTELARELVESHVKSLLLFEPSGRRIWKAVQEAHERLEKCNSIEAFWPESMEEAVRIAYAVTDAGKTCLLSPASPSYGMFKNFEERGDVFRECIERQAKVAESG
jgi:UDP-N-acetylmuramoyl-L-alanine---L-glutamate ligase